MKKKVEIFDDVVEEMDEKTSVLDLKEGSKSIKDFGKRINNSVGAINLETVYTTYCDDKGKPFNKMPTESYGEWDVNIGDGSIFSVKEQKDAQILSFLAQINERLKRVEKKIDEKNE